METVYAGNADGHMMSEKAVDRAIRGHMLVDTALSALLISKIFDIDLPTSEESGGTEVFKFQKPMFAWKTAQVSNLPVIC